MFYSANRNSPFGRSKRTNQINIGEFLARCQPLEVIALVAVVAAALVGAVGLVVWRQVRLHQAEAVLKQEGLRKGLSVPEIQQLLRRDPGLFFQARTPSTDADVIREITVELAANGVLGPELEQYIAIVQAADSPTKQAVAAAFDGLANDGRHKQGKELLLTVIRGLCGPVPPKGDAAAHGITASGGLAE